MSDASCKSMTQGTPIDIKGLDQGENPVEVRKDRARAWFETLRDRMVSALEAVEDEAEASPLYKGVAAGRFTHTAWTRTEPDGGDGGGGEMALMAGRVFEKVGCHTSKVHGNFPKEFAAQIPGAD